MWCCRSSFVKLLSSKKVTHRAISEKLGVQAMLQLEVGHTVFGKEAMAMSNQITLAYLKENVSLQPHVKVRGCPKYLSKLWPSKRRKKYDDSKTQKAHPTLNRQCKRHVC